MKKENTAEKPIYFDEKEMIKLAKKKPEDLKPEEVHMIEEQRVELLPPDKLLFELGDLYKIFGDTTRIKILYLLSRLGPCCVWELSLFTRMEQSAISHQLKILKNAHLVKSERIGRTQEYSLADDHVKNIIELGFEHITEDDEK